VLVSFGLPGPLSFCGRARGARRSGTNLDRESVRVRLPSGLTRHLRGMQWLRKRRPKRQNARNQRRARRRSMRPRRYRWLRKTFSIWSQSLLSRGRCCSGCWRPSIFTFADEALWNSNERTAALRQKRPGAWLFAGLVLTYPTVYYFVFPHARYRHPFEPELLILIVFLLLETGKVEKSEVRSQK